MLWVGLFIVIAVIAVAYWRWSLSVEEDIRIGAETAWEWYQQDEPELLEGLSREKFNALYRKSHFPRYPKYALSCMAAFLIALPAVFAILSGAIWVGEATGILVEPADLAKYVPVGEASTPALRADRKELALYLARDFAGFYYFFGVIAAWLTIVAVFMRQYHKRRPGYFRDEILRNRE